MQTWIGEVSALLERKKRYPATAHARRDQAVAQVLHHGPAGTHLIESHIARSSGVADLDEEALAVLQRAQPFPPLPGNRVNGEQINLSVPIRFKLK
jgi:periplasmic protein TonB